MFWWRRKRYEQDVERELRSHLEAEADERRASGLSPEQAAHAARRALGNPTSLKEQIREVSGWLVLERLAQDLRYGLRALGRNRGFALIAVLTLALGIGANTAIFSLLNAVELRRLPVRDPQQLVLLEWSVTQRAKWQNFSSYSGCDADRLGGVEHNCSFSYPAFQYLRARTRSMSGLAAEAGPTGVQARIGGEIVPALAQFASSDFFRVLGVGTLIGRTLGETDDRPGAAPVAILSYRFWEAHFGSDPGVLGKTIALEGSSFTIVGVAPKEFFGLQPLALPDMWIPLHAGAVLGGGWWQDLSAQSGWLYLIGRLHDGATTEQARAELNVLLPQAPGWSEVFGSKTRTAVAVVSIANGLSALRRSYSDQLHVLMVVVALVLLIGCANIANLLLTRASARRREMAVRMAIGCSRVRLMQQLLTESLLLAGLGTAAGFVLALWASRLLAAFLASRTGSHMLIDVYPDPLVLGFTAAVACVAALLFGLAPAFAGTRENPGYALKVATASGQRSRFGRILVAGEMALALVLLIGAGLFVRTLVNLETLDAGFRRDHLLTFRISRPHDVKAPATPQPVSPNLRERLSALPGVISATWASDWLLVGDVAKNSVKVEGRSDLGDIHVDTLRVGPRYFETMGIPLLAGRSVRLDDCRTDATAIWINRLMAQKFGTNVNPLGRFILRGTERYEIAGVVGDFKYQSLRNEMNPSVYLPSAGGSVFTLRTSSDPLALAGAVREVAHEVNPGLIVDQMATEQAQVDNQLFTEHLMARLSVVFGALALAMAAIGIYGVLAFSVTRRTAEIAIRISLGGRPAEILRMVLGDGLAAVALGAAVGLPAAWALTRLVDTLLFGVHALDFFTYFTSTLLLLAVAALACYIPARRATKVDPMVALRYE